MVKAFLRGPSQMGRMSIRTNTRASASTHLAVVAPLAVRDADEPPEAAKGNVVCERLDAEVGT